MTTAFDSIPRFPHNAPMSFTPLAIQVDVQGDGFTVDGVLFPTFEIFQYYVRLLRAEHRREIWGRALVAIFNLNPIPKERLAAVVLDIQRDEKTTEWLASLEDSADSQPADESASEPVGIVYAAACEWVRNHVNRFDRPPQSLEMSPEHVALVRDLDREIRMVTPDLRRMPALSKDGFGGSYYLTAAQLPPLSYNIIRDVDELKESCRIDPSRLNDILACERTHARTGLGVYKLVSRRQLQVEHCDALQLLPRRFIDAWNRENNAEFPITTPSTK